jgi:hypothetical protein
MATTTNFGWETPDDTDLVKDGAAAIRTLGQSIDTSMMDLEGGTTGQVLSKASNADMDFTWVAIDPLVILDAKGDLITATAADTPARLAVGTNGQVLTADSTQSTGLKWAAAASSSASFTSLGSAALTGNTTITVSGLSGYNSLFVTVDGMSTNTNYSFITFKLNSASANHYSYGNKIQWQASYGSGLPVTVNGSNAGSVQFGRMPNNVGATGNGTIQISGANTTAVKPFLFQGGFEPGGGFYDEEFINGGGYFNASAVISSISLISSTGNFDAGTITVYGSVV